MPWYSSSMAKGLWSLLAVIVAAGLTCISCEQTRLVDSKITSQGGFLSGLQVPIDFKTIGVPSSGAFRGDRGHSTVPCLDSQSDARANESPRADKAHSWSCSVRVRVTHGSIWSSSSCLCSHTVVAARSGASSVRSSFVRLHHSVMSCASSLCSLTVVAACSGTLSIRSRFFEPHHGVVSCARSPAPRPCRGAVLSPCNSSSVQGSNASGFVVAAFSAAPANSTLAASLAGVGFATISLSVST